jgi:radical SAM superfamily enzyme YgiQ (UPF0313 family)
MKKTAQNGGLLRLASYLQAKGIEARIHDCLVEGWENLRAEGAYTQTWGLSDEEIVRRVRDFSPDVIGINAFAAVYHRDVVALAKLLKKEFPNSLIVAGGNQATLMPELLLRDADGAIDFLVLYEGEEALAKIIGLQKQKDRESIKRLPGAAYIENGTFISNPRGAQTDLNAVFGALDPSLISHIPYAPQPTHAYPTGDRKVIDLSITLGCPRACYWCKSWLAQGKEMRMPSIEALGKALDALSAADYGEIIMQDDSFTRAPPEYIRAALRLIVEKGFRWQNNGGVELETLYDYKEGRPHEEFIKLFGETGCTNLFLPLNLSRHEVEKGDRVQKDFGIYRAVAERLRAAGIAVYASFITGVPGMPLGLQEKVMGFFAGLMREGLSFNNIIYAYSPFPDTKIFDRSFASDGRGGFAQREGATLEFPLDPTPGPSYSFNYPGVEVRGEYDYPTMFRRYFSWLIEANCGIKGAFQLTDGKWNGRKYQTDDEALAAAQERLTPRLGKFQDAKAAFRRGRAHVDIPVSMKDGAVRRLRIPAPPQAARKKVMI